MSPIYSAAACVCLPGGEAGWESVHKCDLYVPIRTTPDVHGMEMLHGCYEEPLSLENAEMSNRNSSTCINHFTDSHNDSSESVGGVLKITYRKTGNKLVSATGAWI